MLKERSFRSSHNIFSVGVTDGAASGDGDEVNGEGFFWGTFTAVSG